jgi:hypothetical protein
MAAHQQQQLHQKGDVHRVAFTVPEFCEAHRISPWLFYSLQRKGRGPRVMHAGGRTLVSIEAAADWRTRLEDAGEASP